MNVRTCRFDEQVRHAATSGRWTAELEAHADGCASCRDVWLVTEALQRPLPPSPVSADPRLLWVSARHARRLRGEAQISLILTASHIAACLIVIAAVIRFARWPDAWSSLSFDLDDRALWYGALGLVMAGTLGLFRLMTKDVGDHEMN